jgi:Na+/proline symporter
MESMACRGRCEQHVKFYDWSVAESVKTQRRQASQAQSVWGLISIGGLIFAAIGVIAYLRPADEQSKKTGVAFIALGLVFFAIGLFAAIRARRIPSNSPTVQLVEEREESKKPPNSTNRTF